MGHLTGILAHILQGMYGKYACRAHCASNGLRHSQIVKRAILLQILQQHSRCCRPAIHDLGRIVQMSV